MQFTRATRTVPFAVPLFKKIWTGTTIIITIIIITVTITITTTLR